MFMETPEKHKGTVFVNQAVIHSLSLKQLNLDFPAGINRGNVFRSQYFVMIHGVRSVHQTQQTVK